MENKQIAVFEQIDNSVLSVLKERDILGFEKAYKMSKAIGEIKLLLNAEFMKPIMELQGTSLGFKTDKDKEGGYPIEVVKKCLIEAVFMGVQPYGNMFNIIASNTYLTKEGLGYLLKGIEGLKYVISFELPRINPQSTSAAVVAKLSWTYKSDNGTQSIDIPVKMNAYMGTDAVLGKALRKARKWLYDYITGSDIPEGDISDLDSKNTKVELLLPKNDKEAERIELLIQNATTVGELLNYEEAAKKSPELTKLFSDQLNKLDK